MNLSLQNETALDGDIERLREQFPQTQDLYREVCVLLFFRHGVTPTANKLYQLVRKGSMSAPAEALGLFWENLREKSRVRIEHPDLPDSLKTAAGELAAALWASARASAHEALASCELEARAKVVQAAQELASVQLDRDADKIRLADALRALSEAGQRISALEQSNAGLKATEMALAAQLRQAKEDDAAHLQRLQEARREFTLDLDKLRAASQLADERTVASETRALLEIDRERLIAAKLQKELDAVRASSAQALEQAAQRHRQDAAVLQQQIGDQRQHTGLLQGQLQAATASRDLAADELVATRSQGKAQLAEAVAQASLLRKELEHEMKNELKNAREHWQHQLEEAQRMLSAAQMSGRTSRIYRPAKMK
jgi:hypothetical protein